MPLETLLSILHLVCHDIINKRKLFIEITNATKDSHYLRMLLYKLLHLPLSQLDLMSTLLLLGTLLLNSSDRSPSLGTSTLLLPPKSLSVELPLLFTLLTSTFKALLSSPSTHLLMPALISTHPERLTSLDRFKSSSALKQTFKRVLKQAETSPLPTTLLTLESLAH